MPSAPIEREVPAPETPNAPEPAEPEPTPEAPAEDMPEDPAKPAKGDETEDLFKDADEKAKPAEKAEDVEDLFKDSDDKKAATTEPSGNNPMAKELEDLFADPADETAKSASDEIPAPLEPAPAAVEPVQVAAAVEAPHAMRVWVDNTGSYKVNARLVTVGDNTVRLLKDTGKYTTVRFDRLSADDLNFVRQQTTNTVAGKF